MQRRSLGLKCLCKLAHLHNVKCALLYHFLTLRLDFFKSVFLHFFITSSTPTLHPANLNIIWGAVEGQRRSTSGMKEVQNECTLRRSSRGSREAPLRAALTVHCPPTWALTTSNVKDYQNVLSHEELNLFKISTFMHDTNLNILMPVSCSNVFHISRASGTILA